MSSGQLEKRQADRDWVPVAQRPGCCCKYHRAIELIGKRWTGAIVLVLLDGPLRFSEVGQLVPDLSDRLLSERLKELELAGIVEHEAPLYALTRKGRELEPVVHGLKHWAQRNLD